MTIQDGSPILHIPTEDPTVRIIIVIIFIAVTERFVYTTPDRLVLICFQAANSKKTILT